MEDCNKFLLGYENNKKYYDIDLKNNKYSYEYKQIIKPVYKPKFIPNTIKQLDCGVVGDIPDPIIKFYYFNK